MIRKGERLAALFTLAGALGLAAELGGLGTHVEKRYRAWNAAEITEQARTGVAMPDGTVDAGVSPTTGREMYAAAADAPGGDNYTYTEAQNYCSTLEEGGRKGFRLPTDDELDKLYKNRNKGALQGTFRETSFRDSVYWSRSSDGIGGKIGVWFGDGGSLGYATDNSLPVRCVR